MASVIFFRAANVGGHQVFQPGVLAKKLKQHDVVNIGAAGTLVVRGKASPAVLKEAIFKELPFKPELIVCPAREVISLVESEPFRGPPPGDDVRCYVTILQKALRPAPPFPLELPSAGPWEIRMFAVVGRFALCFQRPGAKKMYPNAVIEKQFKIAGTTRNWNTLVTIGKVLSENAPRS